MISDSDRSEEEPSRCEFVMDIEHPNTSLYRNRPPGETLRAGSWTAEEQSTCLRRLQEVTGKIHTHPEEWGLFSLGIPAASWISLRQILQGPLQPWRTG
jgi:hypothetical protein